MDSLPTLQNAVKRHYERYVYPRFSLLTSVRRYETYALQLDTLWAYFNGQRPLKPKKILLAGSGSFSPYPTALANPTANITALDLAKANLQRAKLHTRLHLQFNIDFIEGSILNAAMLLPTSDFHFVDCYGVLHHIPEVIAALKTLHSLLAAGAVLRIMVYSTGARRSIQAVRTAMRMLGVNEVDNLKKLYKQSKPDSRLKDCIDSHYEAHFDWGLADMFLHPYAKIYQIDELLSTLKAADLEPLQFIHWGALSEVGAEINRLRHLEKNRELSTNFILLAGRVEDAKMRSEWRHYKEKHDTVIALNPVIQNTLSLFPFRAVQPQPKLGFENPVIDWKASRFLEKFKRPLKKSSLDATEWQALQPYLDALFLMETLP
jgi:2-polyprenyl-3-methyl-5-hydroxy-6-metoxy-1,4-benzoquinol methylase